MPAAIFAFFTVLFVILGVVFRTGKGGFLIAGYNTAPLSRKKQYDEKKLCKYMSIIMFLCAACSLFAVAAFLLHKMMLLWLSVGLINLVCVGGLIFMNTGGRVKKQ